MELWIAVAIWLAFGVLAAIVGLLRGHNEGLALGLLLGPLGLLLAFTRKPVEPVQFEKHRD